MSHSSGRDVGNPLDLTDEQLEFLASLFDLARVGEAQQLLSIIDQGVPVNLTNDKGDTLLILAAYNHHEQVVEGLLERGAEVDRVNDRGQTALGCAVFRQNHKIAASLIAAGADPHTGSQSAHAIMEMFGIEDMRALLHDDAQ